MTKVFLGVVNMSISAGWMILAVIVFRRLLKEAPKWLNVTLWGLAGIRLAFPFSIESMFSLIPSSETISPEIMQAPMPAVNTGIPALNQAVNPIISTSLAPAPGESVNPLQVWVSVAAFIWAVGMAFLFFYTVISYWRLRRRVATAVPWRGNIYQCDRVDSPFVLGILRPRIYLSFYLEELDKRAIIAHERAHIRRRDHWWKPLGFLLLTVHWFNPLVWIAYMLFCRDIELACDEKVIRGLDNEQRADYSQALLSCSAGRKRITACPLAFGENGVKERVRSVLNYRKPTFWIIAVAVFACAVIALCFLTDPAGSGRQPADGEQDSTGVGRESDAGNQEEMEFKELTVWEDADLDLDGETEIICVREIMEGEAYELKVVKKDGTLLWSREAGTAHTGRGAFLLYQDGGKDYLVEYFPTMYQGIGSYTCTQLLLEGGLETEENQWTAEFQLPVQEMDGKMRAFAEIGNMIMKDGIVLLSTVEGELVIGPVAAAEVPQLYPVSFGTDEDQAATDDSTASGQELSADGLPGTTLFGDGQPLNFLFASGAGAWGTTLTLYPDGSFEGVYEDGEAVAAPEYPRGICYICRFSG